MLVVDSDRADNHHGGGDNLDLCPAAHSGNHDIGGPDHEGPRHHQVATHNRSHTATDDRRCTTAASFGR